ALIDVLDEEADRRAGRHALEHAREDSHLVGLFALRDEARAAGGAAVEIALDVRFRKLEPRRATVDDRRERRTVAFAARRDREHSPEAVARHRPALSNSVA